MVYVGPLSPKNTGRQDTQSLLSSTGYLGVHLADLTALASESMHRLNTFTKSKIDS